ncbi:MAG: Fe(3+) ABC transporter substrate-binding protein [Salipiger thiooxidans]|jgi:iron(III) transport system substrate-binding protein|uniref:Fe(3+) ABC transporter substrate-binding protein n=1 Tax=Salipiger thiooxidans TaxID=282683 RepID=UPI001A8D9ACB|nr:Fe(3+) ABC transporter substrate-binding protein [Salipiger thiooxidans]MBN8186608.1 Fe(3+) ABC transporter substrate-binding protein [Salipiger thiooxidans]MCA0847729.1 Fe(3+) ABC transporter substrate-binding protein [Salipiger thiooxidans]
MRLATTALALIATAAPALAEEVNLYSYRQPELLAPLTEAFTAETGIDVNVAYLEQGMVERLQAEGDRSPADLVFTVDISRLAAVVNAGVTQSVTSEVLNANVPEQYRDPEGHWFGLTTRARIVYASKDRVDPSEVTTYEDLADPKWKGRICTRSGTHPYNVALVSAMLHHHGEEETKAWLEAVKANLGRKPQGNDRAQVRAIWAGECDIALGNTYYMGQMLNDPEQKEWADSVNVLFPVFEGGGTHVNISGVAMTKSAPNRENALKMMEFLTQPEAQEIYAHANFEYPIAPGTEADELVTSWGSFEADDVNLMTLAGLRADALRVIEEVDFDG